MLLTVEIVGLAALPLTTWFFQSLPDRGYAFAKTLGLLVAGFLVWLAGNVVAIGGSPFSLAIAIVAIGAGGWSLRARRTAASLREIIRVAAIEEAVFLVAFIGWSLLRAYSLHPDILHTEQYMDMALLNASSRSISYPPYDPWMSGHPINYYYFGYLLFGMLIRVAGVVPSVGYNLVLSLIAALTLSCAFSVGYALTRRLGWSLLAPLFVGLLGNSYAALTQIPRGQYPSNTAAWFWQSSRVVDTATDHTINEFPLFSFILGDLHPHVMSLPFTLLAVATAGGILLAPVSLAVTRDIGVLLRAALVALVLGSLFTINSWDFPTYGLLIFAAVAAHGYLSNEAQDWWKRPLGIVVAIGIASVVLFVPFYLHFSSLAHGIGFVHSHADLTQYLEVFGYPLFLCALMIGSLALLLRPIETGEEASERSNAAGSFRLAEKGSTDVASVLMLAIGVCLLVVIFVLHIAALFIPIVLGFGAMTMLQRVLNAEEPNRADALALLLVAVACLILSLTEIIYIKDAFDQGTYYRMNTVFKFYYQAWELLMLAGAYGVYRTLQVVTRLYSPRWGAVAMVAALASGSTGLMYTFGGPQTTFAATQIQSLDGMAWMQASHPGDYGAIQWLRTHAAGNGVVLEAASAQSGYNADYARVSTFSGLPTVMGWPDHEGQWRPNDPEIGRRTEDVNAIYTTASIGIAERLLRRYHVRYVFVGDTERKTYGDNAAALSKFGRFMRVVYKSRGTSVYEWSGRTVVDSMTVGDTRIAARPG